MNGTTIAALPLVMTSLANAVAVLPPQLADDKLNLSILSAMLNELSLSISPVLPSIGALQAETLLTNGSWIAEQVGSLGVITSQIYPADLQSLSRKSLLELIRFGATKFDVTTVWTPDAIPLLFIFIVVFFYKGSEAFLTRKSVLRRAYDADHQRCKEMSATKTSSYEKQYEASAKEIEAITPSRFRAEEQIRRKSKSIIAHSWNLFIGTVALALQLVAYNLFAVPHMSFRFLDAQLLFVACKIVMFSYAAELAFASPHSYIYLHHFLSFAVPLVGEIAAYKTNCVSVLRLGTWWLLQATLEQSTYLAMALYHYSNYLELQGRNPKLQRKLLVAASQCMWFTKWIGYPQKLVPIGMSLYWLARMWKQESNAGALGKFWLAWALIVLIILVLLQIGWVCDQNFAVAAHLEAKIKGTPAPPRQGPLLRFILSRLSAQKRGRSSQPRTTPSGSRRSDATLTSSTNTITKDASPDLEKASESILDIVPRLDIARTEDISNVTTRVNTPNATPTDTPQITPWTSREQFPFYRRQTSCSPPTGIPLPETFRRKTSSQSSLSSLQLDKDTSTTTAVLVNSPLETPSDRLEAVEVLREK